MGYVGISMAFNIFINTATGYILQILLFCSISIQILIAFTSRQRIRNVAQALSKPANETLSVLYTVYLVILRTCRTSSLILRQTRRFKRHVHILNPCYMIHMVQNAPLSPALILHRTSEWRRLWLVSRDTLWFLLVRWVTSASSQTIKCSISPSKK
jgi:hypothetical protein